MLALLKVEIDARDFVDRMNGAARETVNALRRTVDRAARSARREAVKTMAADIGVPVGRFRDGTPLVKASTASSIAAAWSVSKVKIGILNTAGATFAKGSGLTASTFAQTGGGSSRLSVPKAFRIFSNGGNAVMVRFGKGRGAIKALYAEMPNTSMAQANAAPRKVWERIAVREVDANAATEMQRALDGQSINASAGASE